MKRIIVLIVLALAAATAAFATGTPEALTNTRGRLAKNDWQRGSGIANWQEAEPISLTGTFSEKDGHLFLSADGKTYSVAAPGYRRAGVELEEGATVSVEGTLVECQADCQVGADGHIVAESATVDGQTYELAPLGRSAGRGPQVAWASGHGMRRPQGRQDSPGGAPPRAPRGAPRSGRGGGRAGGPDRF